MVYCDIHLNCEQMLVSFVNYILQINTLFRTFRTLPIQYVTDKLL